MPSYKIPYLTTGHLRISLANMTGIFRQHRSLFLVWALVSLITLFVLLWLPNLSLLINVMSSSLSFSSKWEFILSTPEILTTAYDPIKAALLVLIAILQGLVVSLLIFYWSSKRVADRNTIASSGAGLSLAALGASCGACGAGILYPFLASVGVLTVTSASFFEMLLMVLAVVVLVYSIHRILLLLS